MHLESTPCNVAAVRPQPKLNSCPMSTPFYKTITFICDCNTIAIKFQLWYYHCHKEILQKPPKSESDSHGTKSCLFYGSPLKQFICYNLTIYYIQVTKYSVNTYFKCLPTYWLPLSISSENQQTKNAFVLFCCIFTPIHIPKYKYINLNVSTVFTITVHYTTC